MLHLSIMELFLRAIPDSIILIVGAHIFSNVTIDKLKMIKSIIFISLIIYFIRCLPITFGIHILLGVLGVTIILNKIHHIDLLKVIKGVFLTMFIQYVSEILNVTWIQLCLEKNLEIIFSNPATKSLYGLPSLLISGFILYLYTLNTKSRKELSHNEN